MRLARYVVLSFCFASLLCGVARADGPTSSDGASSSGASSDGAASETPDPTVPRHAERAPAPTIDSGHGEVESAELLVARPELRSRLGAWQLHLHIVLGVEPVDQSRAVAFGTSAELLWRCRVGVFAGLLSAKGNAVLAATEGGQVLAAPGDRISVPLGLALRPFGHLGMRPGDGASGWARRLAAGIGLELGASIEHIRTSGESKTVGALHAALALDVPLWGGPVEGGVSLRVVGRMMVAPSVSLEGGAVEMPTLGGQLYGGISWAL